MAAATIRRPNRTSRQADTRRSQGVAAVRRIECHRLQRKDRGRHPRSRSTQAPHPVNLSPSRTTSSPNEFSQRFHRQ